jgi:two-component system, NarL family, nitrate/nitrite response regulator NarL
MLTRGPYTLAIYDEVALRRACLMSFLEAKATETNAGLRIFELAAETDDPPADARLALFSIGALSFRSPEVVGKFEGFWHQLPNVPFVVLADSADAADVVSALRAGAQGYVTAGMEPSFLFSALQFVASGGSFFPPDALLGPRDAPVDAEPPRGQHKPGPADSSKDPALTSRQCEVLRFLGQGQSNKQIARALCMCEATVKVHVRQIMRKLGASNRTQAALRAQERGRAGDLLLLPS